MAYIKKFLVEKFNNQKIGIQKIIIVIRADVVKSELIFKELKKYNSLHTKYSNYEIMEEVQKVDIKIEIDSIERINKREIKFLCVLRNFPFNVTVESVSLGGCKDGSLAWVFEKC